MFVVPTANGSIIRSESTTKRRYNFKSANHICKIFEIVTIESIFKISGPNQRTIMCRFFKVILSISAALFCRRALLTALHCRSYCVERIESSENRDVVQKHENDSTRKIPTHKYFTDSKLRVSAQYGLSNNVEKVEKLRKCMSEQKRVRISTHHHRFSTRLLSSPINTSFFTRTFDACE